MSAPLSIDLYLSVCLTDWLYVRLFICLSVAHVRMPLPILKRRKFCCQMARFKMSKTSDRKTIAYFYTVLSRNRCDPKKTAISAGETCRDSHIHDPVGKWILVSIGNISRLIQLVCMGWGNQCKETVSAKSIKRNTGLDFYCVARVQLIRQYDTGLAAVCEVQVLYRQSYKPLTAAVAERPRDASCHWIFR